MRFSPSSPPHIVSLLTLPFQWIRSWWVWMWWPLWTCTWSRASGTSALKQLPSRYRSLPPIPSSSVHVPGTPHLPPTCPLLPESPNPKDAQSTAECLVFHALKSGSEAKGAWLAHALCLLNKSTVSSYHPPPSPSGLADPNLSHAFPTTRTELQDSAQVRGFVCNSSDPRGWLRPGAGPVCATRSPC